jgi:5-epi-alpha-selinene synthase
MDPQALSSAPSLPRHPAPPAGALRVPELHCPFAPAVHPAAAAVHARSLAWAREVGLAAGESAAARLDAARIAWLVARAHPGGARRPLQIAADWTVLFCLLDDHLERLPSPSAVADLLARLASALCHGAAAPQAPGGVEPGAEPLLRACADLHARLQLAATPAARARVEERVRLLFQAFVREAHGRAARRSPSLQDYLPMREVTVGIHVELALGEIVDGITLSEQARDQVARLGLDRRAANLVAWANDVYTVEKELRDGDPHNLVLVLAAEEPDLARALARAAAMHDDEAAAFAALVADPALAAEPELTRYVAMLCAWVRGHLDWGHETGRYRAG